MLLILPLIIIILLPYGNDCNGALERFINRKKILNYTINIINENDRNVWIEYVYNFVRIEESVKIVDDFDGDGLNIVRYNNGRLTIGIVVNDQRNSSEENYKNNELEILFDVYDIIRNVVNYEFDVVRLAKNNVEEFGNCDAIFCIDCDERLISEYYAKRTLPILESHYYLIFNKNYVKYTKDIYIITFVGSLWLCYLILLLMLAICLKVTTKYSPTNAKTYENWSWVDISLWTIAAACQQGLSFTPTKFCSRLIFLLGYISSYLLYTGFAAGITSVLLNQNRDYAINLMNYRHNGNLIMYPSHYRSATRNVNDLRETFEEIVGNRAIGLIPKRYIDRYHYLEKNTKHYDLYERMMLIKLPILYGIGLYLKDPHLTRRMNEKLLLLLTLKFFINRSLMVFKEKGLLRRMLNRNGTTLKVEGVTSGYSRVSIEHVQSAILLLTFGILLSISFLICEFLYASIRK